MGYYQVCGEDEGRNQGPGKEEPYLGGENGNEDALEAQVIEPEPVCVYTSPERDEYEQEDEANDDQAPLDDASKVGGYKLAHVVWRLGNVPVFCSEIKLHSEINYLILVPEAVPSRESRRARGRRPSMI